MYRGVYQNLASVISMPAIDKFPQLHTGGIGFKGKIGCKYSGAPGQIQVYPGSHTLLGNSVAEVVHIGDSGGS